MSFRRGGRLIQDNLAMVLDASVDRSWTPGSAYWYDISGKENHAQAYGSPATQDSGTLVRNIYFDGSDDRFIVNANESTLSFKTGQTVGILMYHTFTSGRRNPWNQAYGGYGTWTHEGGANMNYYYGGHGANAQPYSAINSGTTSRSTWNYMVVSRSPSTVKWYKNGVEQSSSTTTYTPMGNTTTGNITIGQGYAGWWTGNIVCVHVYTRGLTATEVLNNYNVIKGRFD
jgi:hypothetical protein